MYAPLALNSLARLGSTRDTHCVTLLTLSLGVNIPQLEHWTSSLRPLPPLLRPLDLRFFGVPITRPNRNRQNLTTNRLLGAAGLKTSLTGFDSAEMCWLFGFEFYLPEIPPLFHM